MSRGPLWPPRGQAPGARLSPGHDWGARPTVSRWPHCPGSAKHSRVRDAPLPRTALVPAHAAGGQSWDSKPSSRFRNPANSHLSVALGTRKAFLFFGYARSMGFCRRLLRKLLLFLRSRLGFDNESRNLGASCIEKNNKSPDRGLGNGDKDAGYQGAAVSRNARMLARSVGWLAGGWVARRELSPRTCR